MPASHHRLAFVLPLLVLATPTTASASGCYLGPFVPAADVPAGCPVVVYQHAAREPVPPVIFATRDGLFVDVTGTVEHQQQLAVPVEYPEYDCREDLESVSHVLEPYDIYRVEVVSPIVGETLHVGGAPVHVVAAGPCLEPAAPQPVCAHLPPTCEEPEGDEAGGCSSGGERGGFACGLLVLALARGRGLRARR